ncbi:hypothetical protein D3C77_369910 [compost metagenome]
MQPGNVGFDVPLQRFEHGLLQAGFFRHDHVDDLATASQQIRQLTGIFIWKLANSRFDRSGKLGNDLGIQCIGFRQLACSFGKITDLPRINDNHWKAYSRKLCSRQTLESTCCLQHHQGGVLRLEMLD